MHLMLKEKKKKINYQNIWDNRNINVSIDSKHDNQLMLFIDALLYDSLLNSSDTSGLW